MQKSVESTTRCQTKTKHFKKLVKSKNVKKIYNENEKGARQASKDAKKCQQMRKSSKNAQKVQQKISKGEKDCGEGQKF